MTSTISTNWLFFGHTNDFRLKYAIQSFKHAFTYSGCNIYGCVDIRCVTKIVRLLENALAFNSATDLGLEDKGLALKF